MDYYKDYLNRLIINEDKATEKTINTLIHDANHPEIFSDVKGIRRIKEAGTNKLVLLDKEGKELFDGIKLKLGDWKKYSNQKKYKMSNEERVEELKSINPELYKDLDKIEKKTTSNGTVYILFDKEGKELFGGTARKYNVWKDYNGKGNAENKKKEEFQKLHLKSNIESLNKDDNLNKIKVNDYKLGEKSLNKSSGQERDKKDLSKDIKKDYTNSADIGFDIKSVGIRAELKNYKNFTTKGINQVMDLLDAGDKNPTLRTFGIFFKKDGINYAENYSSIGKRQKEVYQKGKIMYVNNKAYRITDDDRFIQEVMTPLCKHCYFVFEDNFGKSKKTIGEETLIINETLKKAEIMFTELKKAYNVMKLNNMANARFEKLLNDTESIKLHKFGFKKTENGLERNGVVFNY